MRACFAAAIAVLLTLLTAAPGTAQTIYPIDRADILVGAKFDFKVEFPNTTAPKDIKVTVNGRDAAQVFGKAPIVEANEEGLDHSAYWIRDVSLGQPGTYEVTAAVGDASQTVKWEVFGTPQRRARNVILFIADGLSMAHRTAARVLAKGLVEGRYGGELAIDDMPHMALVSTSGTDSIVTDSANSMSAYTTGHKSCVNAMGIYCARNKSGLAHPKVETIVELVKRHNGGMAVGVVTNTEIEDATPAAMVAHVRRRGDYDEIVRMFHDAKPDVMMGGGSGFFLPKSDKAGKRKDEENYIEKFKALGYRFAATATEMEAGAADKSTTRLLGLFHPGNLDGALDRHVLKKGTVPNYPDQPDLADQTQAAIDILSRKPSGFVLMVEAGLIDKYSHALDWERAVYDTIMLDNAVKVAKRFAADRNDTLISSSPTTPIPSASSAPTTTSGRASACATSSASTPRQSSPTIPRPVRTAIHSRSTCRAAWLSCSLAFPTIALLASRTSPDRSSRRNRKTRRRWPTRSTARRKRRGCKAICPSANRRAFTPQTMSCSPPWALERSCSRAASTIRACSARWRPRSGWE